MPKGFFQLQEGIHLIVEVLRPLESSSGVNEPLEELQMTYDIEAIDPLHHLYYAYKIQDTM